MQQASNEYAGFEEHNEWSVSDAIELRDQLVTDGILDLALPLGTTCPACDESGWSSSSNDGSCVYCGFVAHPGESTEVVRKRAFLYHLTVVSPATLDPFSLFNARRSAADSSASDDVASAREHVLTKIGPARRSALQLLARLSVPEDPLAMYLLCVHVGAIASAILGVDDREWLISTIAERLDDPRLREMAQRREVLVGLQRLYDDTRAATRCGDNRKLARMCQFALVKHLPHYPADPGTQRSIVECAAQVVAHTLASSALAGAMGFRAETKRLGCLSLLSALIVMSVLAALV